MKVRRLSDDRLYQLRLKSGKSQGDVSFELRQRGFRVDATSISRWERGENEPRASVIPALADVYGVTLDELYADEDEEDPSMPAGDDLLTALAPLAKLLDQAKQGAQA